ncbi:hypothetical protein ACHAQJ_003760 [Trichoderma viride]
MSELRTTTTTSFTAKWNDNGSGATQDGGFWHPKPQGDMRPLGSVGVPHHKDINGNYVAQLFGPGSTSGPPPVASPVGYTLIWTDKKSKADKDGSFWRPIAPNGYMSAGDVVRSEWSPAPSVNDIWCVREDLLKQGSFGSNSIWNDDKSGAQADVSVWEIRATGRHDVDSETLATFLGPIRASQDYDAPDSSFALVAIV